MANHGSQRKNIISVNISVKYRMYYYRTIWYLLLHVNYKNFINYITLANIVAATMLDNMGNAE